MYDFSQMEAREKERAEVAAKRKWENGKENNQINKGGDKMNGDKQKIDRKVNELEKLNMDLGVVRHYTARGLVFIIIALPASVWMMYMSYRNQLKDGMAISIAIFVVAILMIVASVLVIKSLNNKIKNKKRELDRLIGDCRNPETES